MLKRMHEFILCRYFRFLLQILLYEFMLHVYPTYIRSYPYIPQQIKQFVIHCINIYYIVYFMMIQSQLPTPGVESRHVTEGNPYLSSVSEDIPRAPEVVEAATGGGATASTSTPSVGPAREEEESDQEWPDFIRVRRQGRRRPRRRRSLMNEYEFQHRFADLVDIIDGRGGDTVRDGCCLNLGCWCRQTIGQGGLIPSDFEDD